MFKGVWVICVLCFVVCRLLVSVWVGYGEGGVFVGVCLFGDGKVLWICLIDIVCYL